MFVPLEQTLIVSGLLVRPSGEIPRSLTTGQISGVNLRRWVDNPNRRVVWADTDEFGFVLLWSNQLYEAVGDWTEHQALERLKKRVAIRYVIA